MCGRSAIKMLSNNIFFIQSQFLLTGIAGTPTGIIQWDNCKIITQGNLFGNSSSSLKIIDGILGYLPDKSRIGIAELPFRSSSATTFGKVFGMCLQKTGLIAGKSMVRGPFTPSYPQAAEKKLLHFYTGSYILVFNKRPIESICCMAMFDCRSPANLLSIDFYFLCGGNKDILRMGTEKTYPQETFDEVVNSIAGALCIVDRRKSKHNVLYRRITGCSCIVQYKPVFFRRKAVIVPSFITFGIRLIVFILTDQNKMSGSDVDQIFLFFKGSIRIFHFFCVRTFSNKDGSGLFRG